MRPPETDRTAAAQVLTAKLAATAQRRRIADLLRAVAIGAAGATGVTVVLTVAGTSKVVALVLGLTAAILLAITAAVRQRPNWNAAGAARILERIHPESRNVIVTAEELQRNPARASSWMTARVMADAAQAAEPLIVSNAVPLRRRLAWWGAAIAIWIAAVAGLPERAASIVDTTVSRLGKDASAEGPSTLIATVTAPTYLGGTARTIRNPERLEAVAGSRLSVTVAGTRNSPAIRLGAKVLPISVSGEAFVSEAVLTESTYLAFEYQGVAATDSRKLIPVVVTPDRAPTIRIDQPGKDLLLPNASNRVPIAASAFDDFGLRSLELRFTRVSGSGEQFEFQEGTVPLHVQRDNPRAWTAQAALALSQMKLQPGDSVVYRIVGSDAREGESGMASSETFFVEIAGPGQVTVAGFELPPDRDRYALSQQMIVLKIQRLLAREKSMPREAVTRETTDLAAEQRAIRANFVFLTGGHVEDEEEEAAHSHEIQEGRLEHTARREIGQAIHHMTHAEKALAAVDTSGALPPAKAAVEALQRAFGRNRYILRTLPVRSRIDPARRLSGVLDDAVDLRRPAFDAGLDPATRTARKLLAEILDSTPRLLSSTRDAEAPRLLTMAEEALAVDAGSKEWQQISAALLKLRDALTSRRSDQETRTQLNQALAALRSAAQREAVPGVPLDRRDPALRSAWAEERRGR